MLDDVSFCVQYLQKYNGVHQLFSFDMYKNLRALMNITMPYDLSEEYYLHQDAALKEYYQTKEIVSVSSLPCLKDRICLYQGDITLIQSDAIVNACNEQLLGCFSPLHSCIDNAIHSFAGLQVRRDLMKVMKEQGHDEANGLCKVTKGYNLPAKYIFHTVGPKVFFSVTEENEKDLQSCYLSCLKMASRMNLKTIVFCSISTGVYGYPMKKAATLALKTVEEYLNQDTVLEKVVFDVFRKEDYDIYNQLIEALD